MTDSLAIDGSVRGPLGPRLAGESGTTGWVNSDVPYDFAIGGVPFNMAPSDIVPYQRVTAQFRKDQFDSQASVGEQSLDGFWRRSQLSFHGGAGIKYLDAFTEDVSTRVHEMDGLDPWTEGHGRTELSYSYSAGVTAAHSTALNGYDGSSTPFAWFRKTSDSNKLHKWDLTTDSAVSAAAVTAFAVDPNPGGRAYYDATTTIKTSNGLATIATLSAGSWKGLWWAKERIIALDDLGNFYAVAPHPASGVSITQGSTGTGYFWNGNGRTDAWVVADSPAAIFLGYGRTIYKVVLDSTGTVPTLTGGIVAAELPQDESLVTMSQYLGFLVIVTTKGVRVASVDTDGSLSYGPRLFDLASSTCRSIACLGSKVYFTGKRADDTYARTFVVNLAEPTTDGAFAWCVESDATLSNSATDTGVIAVGNVPVQWDGAKFFVTGSAAARQGFLSTGFIRFGTMEPKAFHSVRVKLDGDGGNVAVVLVAKDGTETSITNIEATNLADIDVPLNLLSPVEFIGLKFVLTADGSGNSPVLLGYQLKALPAPVRNRMVQIPLMCYDSERFSNGQTFNTVGAWLRLQMLEDMESDAGQVVAQDFRTGEQFAAFIEQVQFTNDTPPNRGVSNFGGKVVVTLRKV